MGIPDGISEGLQGVVITAIGYIAMQLIQQLTGLLSHDVKLSLSFDRVTSSLWDKQWRGETAAVGPSSTMTQ